jgi:HJR/Mrr/RecB family endonuclease
MKQSTCHKFPFQDDTNLQAFTECVLIYDTGSDKNADVNQEKKIPIFQAKTTSQSIDHFNPVTVETNILEALKEHGLIDSYEKVGDDSKMPKYIVKRSGAENK